MQETTDSVSCAQKLIQPKRRIASAAVNKLRRAGSPASVAIAGGSPGLAALPLPEVAAATRLPCCIAVSVRVTEQGPTVGGMSAHQMRSPGLRRVARPRKQLFGLTAIGPPVGSQD